MPRDLVLTWPKTTSLKTYLETLKHAERTDQVINFRVASPPLLDFGECKRVYMVQDGKIRGWNPFVEVTWRAAGEVQQARGGGYWPEGWYIVRKPIWFGLQPQELIDMRGFQGFRYIELDRTKI